MKTKVWVKGFGLLCAFGFVATGCGSKTSDMSPGTNSKGGDAAAQSDMVNVPVVLEYSGSTLAFGLADATSFTMSLEGCASGYSSTAHETDPSLKVYKFDQNCLAKLTAFSFGGVNWVPSATAPFTTWLANDTAKFADSTNALNQILVKVASQLDNPVSGTEPVTYKFSEIRTGSDTNIPQTVVGDSHIMSVNGQAAPSFTVKSVGFLSMTTAGAGQFQFTMECTDPLTGSGIAVACKDVKFIDLKYKLVEDTFGGVLTHAQAAGLFSSGSDSVAIPGDVVNPGQNGTINGGFVTKAGAQALTGPNQMHSHPNMLLVLEASGTSYIYYNVDVATLTQP